MDTKPIPRKMFEEKKKEEKCACCLLEHNLIQMMWVRELRVENNN